MNTALRRYSSATVADAPGLRPLAGPRLVEEGDVPAVELAALPDEALFERYQDGDDRAFAQLVHRYEPLIKGFLFKRLKDEERVQDLTQDTFLRVHRARHRYDTARKFSTWIYTIASNLAKNELRNRSRNPLVLFQAIRKNWDADQKPLEWEDNTFRPDDLFRKRHLRQMVESAVEELPEHHRVVFVLRELEGKTYEEIAEITSCNLGTVKSRLNRARNNFAQIIAPLLS